MIMNLSNIISFSGLLVTIAIQILVYWRLHGTDLKTEAIKSNELVHVAADIKEIGCKVDKVISTQHEQSERITKIEVRCEERKSKKRKLKDNA